MSRLSSRKTQKEQHPLYGSWQHLKRRKKISDRWRNDFYLFVEDVGERKENHRLHVEQTSEGFYWKWVQIKQSLKDYDSKASYMRDYMKRNPGKQKNHDLKRTYGITLEQYNTLKDSQNGLCAICNQPEIVFDKKQNKVRDLAVDHNHTTGEIRGLLCTRCNQGIGSFQEDLLRLKQAVLYLEKYNGFPSTATKG